MLIVDKLAQALSVIDYPLYKDWLKAHEYANDDDSKKHWLKCKAYKKAMLSCFTVEELNALFTLTNGENI